MCAPVHEDSNDDVKGDEHHEEEVDVVVEDGDNVVKVVLLVEALLQAGELVKR